MGAGAGASLGDDPDPVIDGPDAEGFHRVRFGGDGHNASFGPILCRAESADTARVRVATGARSANVRGALHGGFMLSVLDQALFVGATLLGRVTIARAVTLGIATQFLSAGDAITPLDCIVEIVRETGRLLFLRGTMEQAGEVLLTYQATVRKLSPAPA